MKSNRLPPLKVKEPAWIFDQEPVIDSTCMFSRYKVAAISCRPAKWNKAENADRLEDFFRQAAKEKPHLMVATEGMLEGYIIFDALWHPERREALLDIAEPLDGPYIARFRKLARSLKTCLCFGFAERLGDNAFNCAIFIDHEGEICGVYHKVSEGTGAHKSWPFWVPGREARAFDTPLGRCGMLICSDRWLPIVARSMVLDGAQLLLIPTYGSTNKGQNDTVMARARENGVPIVQANAAGNNLIVSKGEIAAYTLGVNKITTGFIDVPIPPSPEAARAAEREFLKYQKPMEQKHYEATMAALGKGKPSADLRNSMVAERAFQKLKESHWGEE